MDSRKYYFRLGIFVLASILGLVAAVYILVGPSLDKPKVTVETYFKYSISGLEVGSPVKFRGIQVGQVRQILLSTEAYPAYNTELLSEKDALAVVRMEIDLTSEEVRRQIDGYIKEGLRVQTELAGITGSLYLTFDFLDPEKYPADRVQFAWKPKNLYIPSAPSLSNEIVENVKNFLAGLDSLDIEGNVKETIPALKSLIHNIDRVAQGLDPELFNQLGNSLDGLFTTADGKLKQLDVDQLNKLIDQIKNLSSSLENVAQRTEANKLISSLSTLSQNLNQMIQNNRYDLRLTLQNLNQVTNNLKNLTSELSNDPSAIFAPPRASQSPLKGNR